MISSVAVSGLIKTSASAFSSIRRWHKVSRLAMRWNFYQASAPSQLPAPGEPGWSAFIKNVERYNFQAPLTPHELQRGQEIYKLEQKIEKIEGRIKNMCSMILKSQRKS